MNRDIEFNQQLINAIEKAYPKKNDQIRLLMDSIFLGKEAAYRRIRGNVAFSFSEACIIAAKLGISVDNIIYGSDNRDAVFKLNISPGKMCDCQNQVCEKHDELLNILTNDPSVTFQAVYNIVPYTMLLPYTNLSKFRYFKWHYQTDKSITPSTFSEIEIFDAFEKKQKELGVRLDHIAEVTFIIDRDIISTFIKEILYFYQLNLITDEEITTFRIELLDLINDLEYTAKRGKNKGDKNVWIYLSNIDFESEYVYIKGKDFEAAFLDVYLLNSIISRDPEVCKMQRDWIDSLRKYSTLISVSGEYERKEFFNKQRHLINDMLYVSLPVIQ